MWLASQRASAQRATTGELQTFERINGRGMILHTRTSVPLSRRESILFHYTPVYQLIHEGITFIIAFMSAEFLMVKFYLNLMFLADNKLNGKVKHALLLLDWIVILNILFHVGMASSSRC